MTTACITRMLRVLILFAGWSGFLLTATSCGGSDIEIPDSYGQTTPGQKPDRFRRGPGDGGSGILSGGAPGAGKLLQHGGNAVGASGSWLGKTLRRIRYLAEGRTGGMARQLAAFYGAYAGKMRLAERKELERFLFSRSFFARVRYAFRSRAYRQSGAETLLFRLLYVFGKFKA